MAFHCYHTDRQMQVHELDEVTNLIMERQYEELGTLRKEVLQLRSKSEVLENANADLKS